MSEAWSQLLDIDRLSDGRVELEFAIPLSAFPRLPPQPASSEAQIQGTARFRRAGGFAVVDLEVHGNVQLTCQRCLGPMLQPVDGEAHIALVASETEAERVPPELEPVRAPEGRIRLRDLVDEEVLLALPIVPLHESSEECGEQLPPASSAREAEAADEGGVQRPFADLGKLLKR
jgi:uncharacterized protein